MNRRYKLIVTGVLLALFPWVGFAENRLGLRECMEYAVRKSSKIQTQQADNSDAQIQRRDAILRAFTPTVQAGTSVYSNFGRAVDPESNTYINMTSFNNSYAINGGFTLFDGFTAINNIKIAKTAVKMGVSSEMKLRDDICLAVMEAYFNVVFQTQMMDVLAAQVKAGEQNLKLANRQYELGQKGYADVVQMEADLADKQYEQVQMENRMNDALLTLKDLMLWPIEEHLEVSLDDPVVAGFEKEEQTEAEISAFAKLNHPLALIAKGKLESARWELQTAKGQYLPKLSLGGGWSTNYYTYPGKSDYHATAFWDQFKNNRGAYVQVTLSFPIYDRLSRRSNLSRKKNALRRASVAYEQTQHEIEAEVNRALQDCEGARSAFVQAQKRSSVQEEAYRLGERKMQEGLMSPVEFQTVSNTYLKARAEQLNSKLTYFLKQSVVNYYKGISYLDQQL